jgi:hypothetical protein
MGRDETIDFADVFLGKSLLLVIIMSNHLIDMDCGQAVDMHKEFLKQKRS